MIVQDLFVQNGTDLDEKLESKKVQLPFAFRCVETVSWFEFFEQTQNRAQKSPATLASDNFQKV